MPRIKTILILFVSLCVIPLITLNSYAADIRKLLEKEEMNFGTIIVDRRGDTIKLKPNGNISSQRQSTFSGISTGAKFTAKGDPDAAVIISFSSGDVLSGAGEAMPLGSFTTNAGDTPAFNAAGNITFKVGATLTIKRAQANGNYSGTYLITLDYP